MRVSTEKMALYLPFDEKSGSKAYDYSPMRSAGSDLVLASGCTLTDDAIMGKALHMEPDAECQITDNHLDLTGEWTASMFVKPSGNEISLVVNYTGGSKYLEHTHQMNAGEWVFVALSRYIEGGTMRVRFMVDTNLVLDEACLGTPTGWCVMDSGNGERAIDELKVFNRALSLVELNWLQRFDDDVDYYINGKNFKDFGVEVSNSPDILDALKRKDPTEIDYADYHGKSIDLNNPRYEARELTLECFITATNNMNFVMWWRRFMQEFQFKNGTQRLTCIYSSAAQPLVWDIYLDEKTGLDKTWNDELMVGTFEIHLVEPSPVKKVLRHISQQANSYATFKITTTRKITVSWGDLNASEALAKTCEVSTDGSNWTTPDRTNPSSNISGTNLYVRHKYAVPGEYDIVIHGVIEKISAFTTDEIVVFDLLS